MIRLSSSPAFSTWSHAYLLHRVAELAQLHLGPINKVMMKVVKQHNNINSRWEKKKWFINGMATKHHDAMETDGSTRTRFF